MNYRIFNAAPYSKDDESFTARQIYEQRMQGRFWAWMSARKIGEGSKKAIRLYFMSRDQRARSPERRDYRQGV
jgi:hypothetical protein